MKLHRGRLIDHVHIVTANIDASKHFYKAVLAVLDVPIGGESAEHFFCDELFVSSTRIIPGAENPTGPVHIAFQAMDRQMVENFHKAGIDAGAIDDGVPGERTYHRGYFSAYLLDPDGNFIEAVYHGPASRSARSVVLTLNQGAGSTNLETLSGDACDK